MVGVGHFSPHALANVAERKRVFIRLHRRWRTSLFLLHITASPQFCTCLTSDFAQFELFDANLREWWLTHGYTCRVPTTGLAITRLCSDCSLILLRACLRTRLQSYRTTAIEATVSAEPSSKESKPITVPCFCHFPYPERHRDIASVPRVSRNV